MGLCRPLSKLRPSRSRTARLAASLQLASTARQPKVQDTNQPPRTDRGQPVEAPQLERQLVAAVRRDDEMRRLRTLLFVGATSVLRHVRKGASGPKWLLGLLARRPAKVVAVALANKMARIVYALLTKGGEYRRLASAAGMVPAA